MLYSTRVNISLFFLLICGLLTAKRNLIIDVKPVFKGAPLVLNSASYTTSRGDTISVERLRFYLSGIVLKFENGQQFSEQNSYHLIDAEDPASCHIILKDVPEGKITSMSFNIGVDSAMSVAGAMGGDLDPVKGMYWAWNSGYINAKLEGLHKTFNGKKIKPFEFHIGGYLQPYYALRKAEFKTGNIQDSQITLPADISAWFEGCNLAKENSVMIPGPEAMKVADRYSKMFSQESK